MTSIHPGILLLRTSCQRLLRRLARCSTPRSLSLPSQHLHPGRQSHLVKHIEATTEAGNRGRRPQPHLCSLKRATQNPPTSLGAKPSGKARNNVTSPRECPRSKADRHYRASSEGSGNQPKPSGVVMPCKEFIQFTMTPRNAAAVRRRLRGRHERMHLPQCCRGRRKDQRNEVGSAGAATAIVGQILGN